MPRGFLVKRNKHSGAFSYRCRHHSDDDRSDSDQEYLHTNFGSPDSGYSASPTVGVFRERYGPSGLSEKEFIDINSSPRSSPLSVSTTNYPSPLYYSTFDRLSVCNFSPPEKSPSIRSESASTPCSPNKRRGNSENSKPEPKTPKKPKAARKINFDEDKSSPVSGTIIRDLADMETEGRVICGDIDSQYNCVEVTPEAKAELEKIENKIGDYICQLCKEFYEDAFLLAQHRCSRIVHIEYRCPECDKVFNCPANLASHRRWHKPRPMGSSKTTPLTKILPASPLNEHLNDGKELDLSNNNNVRVTPSADGQFSCEQCGKKFRRQAYLRKHMANHGNEPSFPCKYCSKIFLNENARAKHETQHTTGNKELTCTICNISFSDKLQLENHVRNHSNDLYPCKFCASSFCSSPGLTRHINKCHPSENRQVILLQLPVSRPC